MSSNIISSHISECLRNMRKERGWSLDATSKKTFVSKAMLGQIERGESSPTIKTLWKLATGFEVPFSSFLLNEEIEKEPQENILSKDSNMEITTIFPVTDDVQFEIFKVTISGPAEQISESHPQKAIEHVSVLDGEMNVFFDNEWHSLQSGDSIRFSANQTRGYAAVSPTAIFHNVIYYA